MRNTLRLIMASFVLAACGDDGGTAGTTDAVADTSSTGATDSATSTIEDVATDAATDTGGATTIDAAGEVIDPQTVPLIGEVLTCGTRAEVGGVPRGDDLDRHTVDVAKFPDALCNDGSTAVFYYRPYEGEANRDKWVIQLKGGGGCSDAVSCAQRWCSVLTLFGQTQMVDDINTPDLATIAGQGILARRDDNPWGDYHHVYIQYCSSDGWSGTARDAVLDTYHPCDPEKPDAKCPDGQACPAAGQTNAGLCADVPVRYRVHFLGSRIVDAVITTLRQDGVAGPGGLPDLDAAEHVVFAGSSAGGQGVTANLDRVAELLREHNDACQGETCPLVVDGVIDSIFGPSVLGLDLTHHANCPADQPELCTPEAYLERAYARELAGPLEPRPDASCAAWHEANSPEDEWKCTEIAHVISHHITTPMFVRMGLVDQLLMSSFLELGIRTPDGEPIDQPIEYATLLHEQLEWFAGWSDEAEEAEVGMKAPGVFAPGCPKHETLSEDAAVYEARILFGGEHRRFFQVWRFWKDGGSPAVLVADTPEQSICE
ncbi:MAG: hypothetical protein IT385_26465 [Deltaproteobacteria bacterium]|nr:hypothetical protein [Deltaproteobacteria bacterium]